MQCIPSEEKDLVDEVLVAVAPLHKRLEFGKGVIPTTQVENMNEQQRQIFKNIIE